MDEGRIINEWSIQEIEVIVKELMRKPGFDAISAHMVAIEIQRNQIIRDALYQYVDGDGPVLWQMAYSFRRMADAVEKLDLISSALSGIADSIDGNPGLPDLEDE